MSVSYRPFEGSQSVFVLQFQTVENGGEERGKTTVGLDEISFGERSFDMLRTSSFGKLSRDMVRK